MDRDVRLVVQAMRVCLVAAVIFVLFVIVAAPRVFPHGPLPHGDGACVRTGAVVECAIP